MGANKNLTQKKQTQTWLSFGGPVIWVPVFALTCFGLLFIYSASSVYAMQKYGDEFLFVKKQLLFLFPALVAGYCGAKIPLDFFYKHAGKIFLLGLLFVTLTHFPVIGKKVGGASRWLALGPWRLQPSEFLKIFTILFASLLLSQGSKNIPEFIKKKMQENTAAWKKHLPVLWLGAIYSSLFLAIFALERQPDYGSVIVLILGLLAVIYIHGIPLRIFALILAIVVPLGTLIMLTKSYRVARVLAFLDPYSDPLGKGFQVIQSFVAVANGGIFGQGLGESKQKLFFLPEAHTDFILAVVAEEMGFVGVFVIAILYMTLFYGLYQILLHCITHRERLLATGLFVMLLATTLINMGVVSGALPNKGLPLPFISSGGSSLIANFFAIGLFAQMARRIFLNSEKNDLQR